MRRSVRCMRTAPMYRLRWGSWGGARAGPNWDSQHDSTRRRPAMNATKARPSVNRKVAPLVASLLERRDELRLDVRRHESGATLVDAGIRASGGLEAGRRIAEICMGGLGQVQLTTGNGRWPIAVSV